MAFLLTNLIQNIYSELGEVDPVLGIFTATGGGATTFINTAFGDLESPPEQDAFKGYLCIVVRDAGGAGASPEGRWAVCSAYNDATYTGTIATVTDAIASGDTILLAKQDKFPLQQVIFAVNRGLEALGDVPANANETLTTIADQEEYSVPVAVKRGLKQVWVEDADGDQTQIFDVRNELTSANTASKIYIPRYDADLTIRLIYDGVHAVVSAYNDVINEYIHPRVAVAASILKLLEWYNRLDANQDAQSYMLWLEGQYRNLYLPQALIENPIQRPEKSSRFFRLR